MAKGRGIQGERQHLAKLTDDIVRYIRALDVDGRADRGALAFQFGVTRSTIRKAITGESWAHVR